MLKENDLIEKREERNKLLNNVDVLEKVKDLLLLGDTELATAKQVADYYEVDYEVIKKVIQNNNEELISNGLSYRSGKEIIDMVANSDLKIIRNKGYYTIDGVKIAHKTNALFPKKAILNVAMLLRDSTVAKNIQKEITGFDNNNLTYRREIGFKEQIDLMVDKINNIMVDNIESLKTTKSYEEITRAIKSLLRYETQYSVCKGKYRIDYYFPKIKLCVEYDEKYHESEFQKEKDKNREEDIIRYLYKKDNYINNSCEECDKYEFIRIKQDNELKGIITLTTKVLFKVKDIIDARKMNCKYYDLF